mmetsp:Transcript_43922/g.102680  ORF Transcript_43922/g.102680 Transcript_43922/m.102680 type:complete len:243 (-) Transcript_43922:543-1271(-)
MQVCPSSNAGVPPIPPSLTYVPLSKVLPARPCARPSNLTRAPPHPRTLPAHYPRALTSRVPLRNSWWLLRCSGFPYFTLLLLAEPASSSGAALGATGAGAATAPTTVAARSTGSFCTTGAGCCAFCRCHSFSPIKAKKETPLKPTTMPPISMPVERVCRGGGGAAAARALGGGAGRGVEVAGPPSPSRYPTQYTVRWQARGSCCGSGHANLFFLVFALATRWIEYSPLNVDDVSLHVLMDDE